MSIYMNSVEEKVNFYLHNLQHLNQFNYQIQSLLQSKPLLMYEYDVINFIHSHWL